jgi:hypothetical protein
MSDYDAKEEAKTVLRHIARPSGSRIDREMVAALQRAHDAGGAAMVRPTAGVLGGATEAALASLERAEKAEAERDRLAAENAALRMAMKRDGLAPLSAGLTRPEIEPRTSAVLMLINAWAYVEKNGLGPDNMHLQSVQVAWSNLRALDGGDDG